MWLSGCCGEFRHLQSHFILGNVMFKLVFILSLDDPAISTNNSLTLKNPKVIEHKLMVLNLGFLNVTQTQPSCEEYKPLLCQKFKTSTRYAGFLPEGKLTGWVG